MMNNPNIQVPSNIEAENAILGCVFLDPSVMLQLTDEINYDDFFDSRNKELYKSLRDLYDDGKKIDITTVASYLEYNNRLDAIGGIDHLNNIINFNYSTVNLESYVDLVHEAALKRRTIDSLTKLAQKGYDSTVKASDYLAETEEIIMNLSRSKRTTNFERISEVTEKVKKNVESNANSNSGVTGLNIGFANLNRLTLGLQSGNLIILAARPAMGKSAFAMNLAVQAAMANKDGKAIVAIFSLEMGADQLVERMIACDSGIELGKLKEGNLSSTEWRQFSTSAAKLARLNLFFDDSSLVTVEDIRSKCRKLKENQGLDFVVIDYLQLIQGDPQLKSTVEKVSKISRYLKLMARELEIPVVALAQLSREVEKREEKIPMMSDLRDSGSIEQDADIVMFLYREEYYKHGSRPGEADLIIAKNRSGSLDTLKYIFEGAQQRFIDNNKDKGE